ncbi:sugar ABC transporter ATP-binding protein [Sulfitobacter guttiformis]|uniref:Monosaccharide ABC transporter ATP-binding protein (CUT2 family) n=1 Tax=Sulfitobacter guttiformis TaxID=74349 RepID=A0A420DP66_9RHOB|nr:sugar ABC transporter ATP-binding protein [Sulfitobacter guttiformis]KIN73287.1 Ribose import ATP-binding protein RbsA 1 [Sulfitobacter guttiformis KCTC 32187]RKE95957.1 monosaccharide ABC transporter ATP-binding protein (CUT2 family) [Sulfitobacter guttiformis]
MTHPPLIQTTALSKSYPGVLALDAVDLDLRAGEVHVLFGENGAGKSTLISMLAGSNTPSAGNIQLNGETVSFKSVADAQKVGIYTVFQEFSLIPTLTVAQNIFLGKEPKRGPFIDHRAMRTKAAAVFAELDFDIDPQALTAGLSRAQQQMVEIAKAFHGDLSVLILDEPTASLTDREVDHLFDFIKRLKADGVGILYISHRMQEFARIADRITVLRDGAKIGTVNMADTNDAALVEMMTGRSISEIYPKIAKRDGEVVMQVKDLRAPRLHPASFEIRAGEVLGVAGLVGSGKSRLFRTIMDLYPRTSGSVTFRGRDISRAPTREIIQAGVYYLSPDRKHEGLDLAKSSNDNLAVNPMMARLDERLRGFVNWSAVRAATDVTADKVELPQGYRPKLVSQLSGGNQQKVLFGKAFGQPVDLYIFDEPTVGVDMGTRAALYMMIKELAEAGKAVVLISSDLPEVLNLSHRALVFAHGRISAELDGESMTEELILKHFFDETGATA